MHSQDEQLQRLYFRLEELQRQRLWLQRVWHPETFTWAKRGAPPPMTETKRIRQAELAKLGFGEPRYQELVGEEAATKAELEREAQEHPLWPHFERIKGLGPYLCGAFVAAGGDVERAPTVSAFWKGMGLDLLPDGTVPRRIRGRKDIARKIPCLPHVSRVGEQIRQQLLRSNGRLKTVYDAQRAALTAAHPERPKIRLHKSALRNTQKLFYACCWREWRLARGLDVPEPYAFAILQHAGRPLRMTDFYDELEPKPARIFVVDTLRNRPDDGSAV